MQYYHIGRFGLILYGLRYDTYTQSTFYLPSEEVAISAANYNYNHYNLPFSHIMIAVTISDEAML